MEVWSGDRAGGSHDAGLFHSMECWSMGKELGVEDQHKIDAMKVTMKLEL